MEDNFSTDRGRGEGRGVGSAGNVSRGEQQMKLHSLHAHPLLTSCGAACFLTGLRPVLVHGPGVGDP